MSRVTEKKLHECGKSQLGYDAKKKAREAKGLIFLVMFGFSA